MRKLFSAILTISLYIITINGIAQSISTLKPVLKSANRLDKGINSSNNSKMMQQMACTWSDNCSGSPTSVSFCTTTSSSNTTCGVSALCDATDNVSYGAPDWVQDICDECWHNNGGDGCFVIDPSGECAASASLMGKTVSCAIESPLCGSPENTSYAEVCFDELRGSVDCPFTYSITNIACAGGGGSLQWAVYDNTITCANAYTAGLANSFAYCQNATSGTTDINDVDVSSGYCHLMIFDGNAAAGCTWDFSVSPSASLTVAPIAPDVSVCQECDLDGGGIPCVTVNGGTSECYSELSFNGGSYSSSTTSWSYCPPSVGSHTVTLDARLDMDGSMGAACSPVTGTTANITITVLPNTDPSCGCGPLSLEFDDFDGYKKENFDNVLKWSTSNEKDVKMFEVQSSKDGVIFETIGKIKYSSTRKNYSYDDRNIKDDMFYRIKQLDIYNDSQYSKAIKITKDNVAFDLIAIGPNPFQNKLEVTYKLNTNEKVFIHLFDISGKLVSSTVLSKSMSLASLDTKNLNSGVYFMQIIYNNQMTTKKIIKE